MKTDFTAAQRADPVIAEVDRILRSCVHCGFCTATCPTYLLTGDELDSPRGRIYLMKDMFEAGGPADHTVRDHLDRCLTCLNCMTTCPAGVDYGHLVEHGRNAVEAAGGRPLGDRLLRGLLAAILPYRRRFRLALGVGRLVRPLLRLLPGRLARFDRMVPQRDRTAPVAPGAYRPDGPARLRVGLVVGCVQPVLRPAIDAAALRLLTRRGAAVTVVDAGCCGALPLHMGRAAPGRAMAAALLDRLAPGLDRFDALVTTASGCGSTLKDYAHLFADDPARAVAARRFAGLVRDISEVVADLGLGPVAVPRGLSVAYHEACSLQHGQRLHGGAGLLAAAGFQVRQPRDGHLCCGSAGTYNLLQPALADRLGTGKAAALAETGAAVVAAGNIGCLTQIALHGALPAVHLVELLDWATGGPAPAALAGDDRTGIMATGRPAR